MVRLWWGKRQGEKNQTKQHLVSGFKKKRLESCILKAHCFHVMLGEWQWKTKVQHADLQNTQAGKVVPSQLLVTDARKRTGKHGRLTGDGSAYIRQNLKLNAHFLQNKMLLAFVLTNNSENEKINPNQSLRVSFHKSLLTLHPEPQLLLCGIYRNYTTFPTSWLDDFLVNCIS